MMLYFAYSSNLWQRPGPNPEHLTPIKKRQVGGYRRRMLKYASFVQGTLANSR